MRVAVVGSGVSGLVAAHAIARVHEVELFEAADRLGGHVNTIDVQDPVSGRLAIDTGFIVHNRPNYPNLVRLFAELGVPTQPSDMSLSVESPADGFTYRAAGGAGQRRMLASGMGRRLFREIVRFLMVARRDLTRAISGLPLADYVRSRGFSDHFLRLYVVPMTAAIWSMPPSGAAAMPARFVLRFFDNHGLLGLRRHSWRTVTGGARRYVEAIIERFQGPVHVGVPVREVRRDPDAVRLETPLGRADFDAVVLATHGDQALRLLGDADALEREVLGVFRTTPNRATLHHDASLLPDSRATWASWNVRNAVEHQPVLTYHANSLQRLSAGREYCISLNADERIDPAAVIARIDYRHPAYDAATVAAQGRLPELDGRRRTYFCGAWQRWGFHEDGAASGLRVAAALGAPW